MSGMWSHKTVPNQKSKISAKLQEVSSWTSAPERIPTSQAFAYHATNLFNKNLWLPTSKAKYRQALKETEAWTRKRLTAPMVSTKQTKSSPELQVLSAATRNNGTPSATWIWLLKSTDLWMSLNLFCEQTRYQRKWSWRTKNPIFISGN